MKYRRLLKNGMRDVGSEKPRIVVDTNVVMGGLINPVKASGRVVGLWLAGEVIVLISPALRAEYLHTFSRMRFGPMEAVERRERLLGDLLRNENLIWTEPGIRVAVIRDDPSDNRLLECAAAGRADYIVSQDRHLLQVGEYEGVVILRASDFLERENL
ncbi:MAG: putative toxin-antitoxin system toxin component, PIN family [Bacillota bacterium]